MRLTINFKDDILDSLETAAKQQGKSVEGLIVSNLETLAKLNPKENQILLKGPEIAALSEAVGGASLKTGADIVKLVQNCFRVGLDGSAQFKFQIEDLELIKEQYQGLETFMTFDEYAVDFIGDAISLHLHGSVRPRVAYK